MGLNIQKGNINRIRKANHCILKKLFIDILEGLILGDGSLTTRYNNISAYYEHGDKRYGFVEWLLLIFKKNGIYGRIYPMRKALNGAYKYKTITYYELGDLRGKWYPNGKKQIPDNFIITPESLKLWFIGDGNYTEGAIIDSSLFSGDSMQNICHQLKDINIDTSFKVYKDRKRIRILKKSEDIFFYYILNKDNNIPLCYHYKFPKGSVVCR